MYDEEKAQYAVSFINNLKHTKGKWHGVNFDLLDWQDTIIKDVFGTVKDDGYRQYNFSYVEIERGTFTESTHCISESKALAKLD